MTETSAIKPVPETTTMKSMLRIAAIVVAVCITVAIVGSFLLREHLQQSAGIKDDFQDVKLAEIITFSERANSAYHELKDFRHEYGPTSEIGEFQASGLRFYVDTASTAQVQWVVMRGTANLKSIITVATLGSLTYALHAATVVTTTATDDLLGSDQWGAGPTGLLLKQTDGRTYGVLANQLWFFGASDEQVNATYL